MFEIIVDTLSRITNSLKILSLDVVRLKKEFNLCDLSVLYLFGEFKVDGFYNAAKKFFC